MIRVLYADDDLQVTEVVKIYFASKAPDCALEIVPNGRACLDRMARGGIDVLLLDFELPDLDGLHILSELASRGDPTPVIMVSGKGQTKLAVQALRAGAVDCIDKTTPRFLELPLIVQQVHGRQQEKFAAPRPARGAEKYNILLIEDSGSLRKTLADFLAQHAPRLALVTLPALAGLEGALARRGAIDAVIVGPNPGAQKPLDVLRQFRSHSADVPMLVLAARNDGESAVAAFKLGAQDYILQGEGYLSELVFSLHSLLRHADADRLNQRLSRELAELNHSLEAQVVARTRELSTEVAVRQQAEHAAAEHAARLQVLSKRLFKVQEDERRAIARELHDQIGQMLTGLKMQLEAMAKAAQGSPGGTQPPFLKDGLAESLALATELMGHVRELTQQFRPRILDDLGLAAALEWHARLFQKQTNVQTILEVSLPQARMSIELEIAVFRIVQEALTNVARHAGCAAASVTVTQAEPGPGTEGGRLLVEIADRGRGFDLEAVLATRNSIGLTGLTERVTLAGGTVEIFSRIGQGTRIHAEFPLGVAAEPKSSLVAVPAGGRP